MPGSAAAFSVVAGAGAAGCGVVAGVAGFSGAAIGTVATPCMTFFSWRMPLGQGEFWMVRWPAASVQR